MHDRIATVWDQRRSLTWTAMRPQAAQGWTEGIAEWNRRRDAGEEIPNLSHADLRGADLRGANLSGAHLERRRPQRGRPQRADLGGANLSGADLSGANLVGRPRHLGADLSDADLSGPTSAGPTSAAPTSTAPTSAGPTSAGPIAVDDLRQRRFIGSKGSRVSRTLGPSTIGMDTLFRSKGKIPEAFLRGCGVPDALIVNRFASIRRDGADPVLFVLHQLQHEG